MKSPAKNIFRNSVIAALALVTGVAQAHTGHETSGLFAGLVHPFGLDHLLAMVAVGIWSVSALPTNKAWWGPATFMLSLVLSAALGALGVTIPFLEHLISLSVVVFGAMLILARRQMPLAVVLGMVGLAASLHGLAHGAETPEAGFSAYAAGFLLTTATLHFGGMTLGRGISRYLARSANMVVTGLGALCGGTGLYLLSQL